MSNKISTVALAALMAALLTASEAGAWGAARVSGTRVSPYGGVHHGSRTVVAGPGGVYTGGRSVGVGPYGSGYRTGYGGVGYGSGYHYHYDYGGAAAGGYRYGYVR